jgi:hypothetical protein
MEEAEAARPMMSGDGVEPIFPSAWHVATALPRMPPGTLSLR